MCYKHDVCPHFERRSINGKPGSCANCEYIRSVERTSFYCKIGLGISVVLFVLITNIVY